MEFVAIIDTHLKASSNVRTDQNYAKTICDKIAFAVSKANEWNARLLIAGDMFDTPTVPDLVKSMLADVLLKAVKKPIVIYGNHCTTFANVSNNYKTSTYLLDKAGVWKALVPGQDLYLEEEGQVCKLAVTRPMKDEGIPQLGLFHGFLNKQDGDNTFLFEDVPQSDPSVIVLGHDHVQYEPVPYNKSVIYRIGALTRGIRNYDQEYRTPNLLRIRLKEGKWFTKLYEVPCIHPSLIFKEKDGKPVKVENDYSALIEQIKQSSMKEITLMSAVQTVAPANVAAYVGEVLTDIKNLRQSK